MLNRKIDSYLAVNTVKKGKRKITPADLKAAENLYKLWQLKKKELNLTQKELAELMGVTQGSLSSWFHGYAAIGTNALLKFSRFLGVAPTEIRPDFAYTDSVADLSPDVIRMANKLQGLPEGVRLDIERTIDNIINSNYAVFIANLAKKAEKINK